MSEFFPNWSHLWLFYCVIETSGTQQSPSIF